MTREIIIVGSSGFAKEMLFLLKHSHTKDNQKWLIKGFVDTNRTKDDMVMGYPILGDDDWLLNYDKEINVVIGIGDPFIKKSVADKFSKNLNIHFPNIIADTALIGENVVLGKGCIICDMNILTVDICIGDFVTLNLSNTVGHDAYIGDYTTVNPGSNISGNVNIGKLCMIGTGSKIIQGLQVGDEAVIGAGTIIIRDVIEKNTVVGNPGKVVKVSK